MVKRVSPISAISREPPIFPHQIFSPFLDQDALKKETFTGGKEEDEVTLGSENKLWKSVVSSPHGSEHLPTEHLNGYRQPSHRLADGACTCVAWNSKALT